MGESIDRWAECYRRWLNGDEAAFDELMSGLFYGLVSFLRGIVKNTPAAEDAAMDAFTDLVVNRHRYNFRTQFKTYLYMLGRSRAIDRMRRDRLFTLAELSEETAASDDEELDEKLDLDEKKKALRAAIKKLPQDMRTAVHLVYFEGMTYANAGKVMKKNAKQVDNLIYRAKQELKALTEETGI